jgi:hypothetical protein
MPVARQELLCHRVPKDVWVHPDDNRLFQSTQKKSEFCRPPRARRMAGVGFDDAAVAFGCHPETVRKHYVALDETEISDRVMDKIHGRSGSKNGEKTGETNGADAKKNVNGSQLGEKSGEI